MSGISNSSPFLQQSYSSDLTLPDEPKYSTSVQPAPELRKLPWNLRLGHIEDDKIERRGVSDLKFGRGRSIHKEVSLVGSKALSLPALPAGRVHCQSRSVISKLRKTKDETRADREIQTIKFCSEQKYIKFREDINSLSGSSNPKNISILNDHMMDVAAEANLHITMSKIADSLKKVRRFHLRNARLFHSLLPNTEEYSAMGHLISNLISK